MTKLCSVCGTENRDEALFCRACGTAFAAAPAVATGGAEANVDNICGECGFRNKPGIRYCANCGMSLVSVPVEAASDAAPPFAGNDPYAGLSPPPISYQSFATVAPYPPAPAPPPGYPPVFDAPLPSDLPDPDAAIAIRQHEAYETQPSFAMASEAPKPNRARLVFAIVVLALIAAGIAAWMFLGSSSSARPESAAAAPVLVPPSPEPASAPAMIIEAAPPVSTPPATASASEPQSAAVAPPAPAASPLDKPPPAAAAPLPQVTDPQPVETAEAEAKRLAAEKLRRDKAARDKTERDAKAKALIDQRDQAAAGRAEQDAQARRRADEAQRARPSVAPTAPPGATTPARGVREMCAGRGTIAEAVCQSRLCGAPEHANEAICRQLREADERRRNFQN
jgi:hypothetical protein